MTRESALTPTIAARAAEFAVVFLGIPSLLAFYFWRVPPIPVLLVIAVGAYFLLRADGLFERVRLRQAPPGSVRRILLRTIPLCLLVTLLVALFRPSILFSFPRQNPGVWLAVMLLYPLFSVYPQELVYRAFFFHRYARVFPSEGTMVTASALAFGFAHIVFGNWISVVFTTVGGFLFADTYRRTQSLTAACIEHSIFGCYVFSVGLGQYFVHTSLLGQ
jgi:membrane protease YdiL (CAAX protease family)